MKLPRITFLQSNSLMQHSKHIVLKNYTLSILERGCVQVGKRKHQGHIQREYLISYSKRIDATPVISGLLTHANLQSSRLFRET